MRKNFELFRTTAAWLVLTITALTLGGCGSSSNPPANSNTGEQIRTTASGGQAYDATMPAGNTERTTSITVPAGAPCLIIRTGQGNEPRPAAGLDVTASPDGNPGVVVRLSNGVPTDSGLAELPTSPALDQALAGEVTRVAGVDQAQLPPLSAPEADIIGRRLASTPASDALRAAIGSYMTSLPVNAGAATTSDTRSTQATGVAVVFNPQPGRWTVTLKGQPTEPFRCQVVAPTASCADTDLTQLVGTAAGDDSRGYYRAPYSWLYWTARGIYMARGWWALVAFVCANPPLVGLAAVIYAYVQPPGNKDRAWDALLNWMASRAF